MTSSSCQAIVRLASTTDGSQKRGFGLKGRLPTSEKVSPLSEVDEVSQDSFPFVRTTFCLGRPFEKTGGSGSCCQFLEGFSRTLKAIYRLRWYEVVQGQTRTCDKT